MTIEELFGTLQQSTVASWRKHLRTAKYAKHMALDEFYKEIPEKVDALIEGWMGAHGKKVSGFENLLKSSNMNTLKYLGELKKVCKEGYSLLEDNEELISLMDDIVNLINSTLYKVKELSENKFTDLKDYISESLITEATDNSKEWDTVLKELSSQSDYSNYSQLSGLENLGEYAGGDDEALSVELESWFDEYNDKITKIEKKLKKIDVRDILTEIAHFIANSYEKSLMHYGDQRQEIAETKHEYIFVNNAVDFGVEEEDYWTYYEYTGNSQGKKYAAIIAKYADCSEDYDDPDDFGDGEEW